MWQSGLFGHPLGFASLKEGEMPGWGCFHQPLSSQMGLDVVLMDAVGMKPTEELLCVESLSPVPEHSKAPMQTCFAWIFALNKKCPPELDCNSAKEQLPCVHQALGAPQICEGWGGWSL